MATFPELEPNTRSYDFGVFPLTEEPSLSAGIVRFRHSATQQNYQLTLGYNAISDAQATLIRNHYQSQGGGYRSFLLPAIIWRGHTSIDNIVPAETLWRYSETPEEEHLAVGRINVTITLVSDGVIPLTEAPGFTGGITASITAGAAIAGDPYFANVSLLLHMDGSNNSTTFTDSSTNGLTVTANGNAKISTAQSKFGGSSGLFDGTGDYLSVDNSAVALTGGDFTIEGWVRLIALPTTKWGFAYNGTLSSNNNRVQIELNPNGTVNTFLQAGTGTGSGISGAIVLSINTWYYIAFAKSGNNIYQFIDGVLDASGTYSTAIPTTNTFYIGQTRSGGVNYSINGYIDDFRVTKGVARYTTGFTPPTAAFPDF